VFRVKVTSKGVYRDGYTGDTTLISNKVTVDIGCGPISTVISNPLQVINPQQYLPGSRSDTGFIAPTYTHNNNLCPIMGYRILVDTLQDNSKTLHCIKVSTNPNRKCKETDANVMASSAATTDVECQNFCGPSGYLAFKFKSGSCKCYQSYCSDYLQYDMELHTYYMIDCRHTYTSEFANADDLVDIAASNINNL